MASPVVLDVAALLLPIAGDEPAGTAVAFTVRQKLDAARKEEEPHPDDPTQAAIPKKADWPGIVRTTTELLTDSSKDLLVAARLTEALTRQHGFAGLRDGLQLLHDLIEQCWDRLHPIPEEGEGVEVRAGSIHWLSDPDRGARFPNAVRELPLVRIDGATFGWLDHKRSQEGRGPIPKEDFERALPVTDDADADIGQVLEQLDRLEQLLNTRFQENAPGLLGLRQAVEDCQQLLRFVLRRLGPTDATDTAPPPPGPGGSAAAPAPGNGTFHQVTSREEAYRQVAQIANVLERLEPHSPIPDLLRRAVELGRMPFRQLVRELVRDEARLTELRREFGIKEPEAPA